MFGFGSLSELPLSTLPEEAASGFVVAWASGANQLVGDTAMKKNTASQVIGVQMVSATDGSAFTGTATVVITGDGGTQSASGGTGPTHEGNGFHTYIPTQAETNFDHIGFTFTGSGAIPVTVQVYTTFPQTVDIATQVPNVLNTTASGNIGIDWANVENPTSAVVLSTTTVSTVSTVAGLGSGALTQLADSVWDETLTAHVTADSGAVYVKDILTDTAEIGAAGAGLTEAGGTGDHLSAIPWNASWDAEVESEVNDALDTAISELGVAAPTATPTLRTGLMLLYMALRNKLVVQTSGTDALEIYNDAGTKIASKLITDDGSDYTEAEMA